MIAHVAAAPALERLEGRRGPLVLAGRGRDVAYVDLDGFVLVLTGPRVPLLPNAIALTGPPAPGATIEVAVAGATVWEPALALGDDPVTRGHEILATLDQPSQRGQTPLRNPRPPSQRGQTPLPNPRPPSQRGQTPLPQVSERGLTPSSHLNKVCERGLTPSSRLNELALAVGARDASGAATAAAALIGRGEGLTPAGDDLVAGAAAVVAAGPWDAAEKGAWLEALIPKDLRRRTTALSATLLELAATGRIAEPVHGLFGPHWRPALDRLLRLGHSTGRAYALGAATAATRLRGP